MYRDYCKYLTLALLFALMQLAIGCSDIDHSDNGSAQDGLPMNVEVNIEFNLDALSNSNIFSRATENASGVNVESVLRSLSIFIVGFAGDIELPSSAKCYRFTENLPSLKQDGMKFDEFNALISTTSGKKRMYLAANLPQQQEQD